MPREYRLQFVKVVVDRFSFWLEGRRWQLSADAWILNICTSFLVDQILDRDLLLALLFLNLDKWRFRELFKLLECISCWQAGSIHIFLHLCTWILVIEIVIKWFYTLVLLLNCRDAHLALVRVGLVSVTVGVDYNFPLSSVPGLSGLWPFKIFDDQLVKRWQLRVIFIHTSCLWEYLQCGRWLLHVEMLAALVGELSRMSSARWGLVRIFAAEYRCVQSALALHLAG